ncbi:DNA mismatch repair protein MutS [Cytophagaceae bacterium YF14B1]|uniref:DNA mismatch repair protein MutS n=1 Tax=Xanthocytophaga flava TaxID=3048013 RepID=A0AAE3U8F4_9BACT|nr:DNA mismatch repair protein MutS [Xanthocytophaga flavus]MDJ1483376.1 DNA mismatch repair protein MutS [Xanthocytophaga flavus]
MEIYQQRKENYASEARQWHKKFNQVSWLRVVVFLAGVGLTWFVYQLSESGLIATGVALFSIVAFFTTLKWHNRIEYQRNHFRYLSQINNEEWLRLEGKFLPENTGSQFNNPHHPYSGDLDIFGPHSLFVLLNRTQTTVGNELLAKWIQAAGIEAEIRQRQEAVAELGKDLEWQQNFQARGRHHTDGPSSAAIIREWLQTPASLHKKTGLIVVSYLMPAIMAFAIILAALTDVSYHFPFVLGLINIGIVGLVNKQIQHLTDQAYETSKPLQLYADLLKDIERHPFQSSRMVYLKNELISEGHSSSEKIEQLAGISANLLSAHNPFFGLFANGLVLWNIFWAIRLERWKANTHTDLSRWLNALAETEALNSLAGFYHANSDYVFPTLVKKGEEPGFCLISKSLGHPLLLARKRVINDFQLIGKGKTIIVTGSNMSGKSTFLRTVGINAVLAMTGAPVCASEMKISLFQVFTSMRTQDNLEESVSSFYAELQRLKQLIDYLPQGNPIFYLLDEILKGTNSQDRHEGAKALIRQLHRYNASGLISTHDLTLSEMVDELPASVENYSFNSEIINDQLYFDYKLQTGVCRSFNASKLMQQIGIEMYTNEHPPLNTHE